MLCFGSSASGLNSEQSKAMCVPNANHRQLAMQSEDRFINGIQKSPNTVLKRAIPYEGSHLDKFLHINGRQGKFSGEVRCSLVEHGPRDC